MEQFKQNHIRNEQLLAAGGCRCNRDPFRTERERSAFTWVFGSVALIVVVAATPELLHTLQLEIDDEGILICRFAQGDKAVFDNSMRRCSDDGLSSSVIASRIAITGQSTQLLTMKPILKLFTFIAMLCSSAAGAERPNIIVVLLDDMGWGDFSCFGNKDAQTPHADQLAKEGIRFSQFYVNSPICSPSRTALTTGQYPQRWKITSYLNNRADNARRGMADWLDPTAPSLARTLQQGGYATGHFGKWHMGGQRDVDDAPEISEYGFDESLTNFEGMGAKLLPLTMMPGASEPGKIWADAERLGQPVTWMQRSQITGGFVDAAIPFIDKASAAKKPFFVNLWPDDVHSPFWPPVDQWADGKRGLYRAVLTEADRQLGKLFDHIRNTPALRDNTIILICSDNGPEPGAGSAGPFRGTKATLYEGGTRSSLIAWAPGMMEKSKFGTHNEQSVFAAFDLAPSLLAIANLAPPEGIVFDGENLAPVLLGNSSASRKAPIYWRRPPDRKTMAPSPELLPALAVREGDWKLLCEYDGSEPQLYDLADDLSETDNIAAQHPDQVARLTSLLLAWHKSMPPDNGPALANQPATQRKSKRSGPQ